MSQLHFDISYTADCYTTGVAQSYRNRKHSRAIQPPVTTPLTLQNTIVPNQPSILRLLLTRLRSFFYQFYQSSVLHRYSLGLLHYHRNSNFNLLLLKRLILNIVFTRQFLEIQEITRIPHNKLHSY